MKVVIKEKFAKKAYRTLVISYKDYSVHEFDHIMSQLGKGKIEDDIKVLEKDLTLIGIFALEDPLRDEIKDSVAQCKKSGITIRMVTGDNLDTAIAIAV
jgi:P-type E1-E2 ATPase